MKMIDMIGRRVSREAPQVKTPSIYRTQLLHSHGALKQFWTAGEIEAR